MLDTTDMELALKPIHLSYTVEINCKNASQSLKLLVCYDSKTLE